MILFFNTQGIDVWNMYYTFTVKETTKLVTNIYIYREPMG